MSSNTLNQQSQQLQYSPLPPQFKSKSFVIRRDSRLTIFCKIITKFNNFDNPYINTTFKNLNRVSSKSVLDPYLFALYHEEQTNFQNI